MSNLMLGIILGLWSGVAMVLDLSGLGVRTPIITGLLAGLCCGDLNMGPAGWFSHADQQLRFLYLWWCNDS